MKLSHRYPKRVQLNLELIEDAFYDADKGMQPEVRLLVAALRSLDFCVTRAMAGYPKLSWAQSETPWVDIASPLAKQLEQEKGASVPHTWWFTTNSPDYEQFLQQVRQANAEASSKLHELLGEFYSNHQPLASTRLTFDHDTWFGDFRLLCQGAKTAGRLNKSEYIQWLQSAQSEMQAFAEFLCSKM